MNFDSSIVVNQKVGLWECDLSTGKIEFKNNFFKSLGLAEFGISYSDLTQLRQLIHPDDLKNFDTALKEVSNSGENVSVIYRIVTQDKDIRVRTRLIACGDDQVKPERISAYTEIFDSEESHEEIIFSLKEEVSKLNSKYKTLLNALFPDFIFVFDTDFVFREIIMPDGLNLFHDPESLIGSNGRLVYSPEVSELFIVNIKLSIQDNRMKEIEYHLTLEGERYYYRARLVPIGNDRAMCLIHDIGDRVRRINGLIDQRMRAEESDKMKSAFLANMSHEIRTPLNAIVGFTGFISKEADPEKRSKYAKIINNSSVMLLQLVNDVLDLSRIESGKTEIICENTDVNALVREIGDIHRSGMSSEVKLIVEIPEAQIYTFTDRNRVKQVLFNFLSNAVKNTQSGSITLKVEDEGRNLKFSVKDTGKGIPEDKLQAVFERFEKIDSFVQGTGLGLSICKSLVGLLGGKIKVESQLGVGSIFSFTIPGSTSQNPAPQDENIDHVKDMVSVYRKRILIAEDSEQDYMFAKGVLEGKYDIARVTTGEEAVNFFIREKPDLILVDISLPVIDGIEVIKKVRATSSSIPIIAVITNDFYTEQKLALKHGCNDVMSKPYSASKLEEFVLAFI